MDGILYHKPGNTDIQDMPRPEQLATPSILRDDLLRSCHDSLAGGGHQGLDRTFHVIKLKYIWSTMHGDVYKYNSFLETFVSCRHICDVLRPLKTAQIFQ